MHYYRFGLLTLNTLYGQFLFTVLLLAMKLSPPLLNSSGSLTEYLPPEVIRRVSEDDSVMVVYKPAFYRCQLPDDHPEDSIVSWLCRQYEIDPELMNEELNPALSGGGGFGPMCHRLDKQTSGKFVIACTDFRYISGPVLIARKLESWKFIRRQFQKEQVTKRYVCLVDGICANDSGMIDSPIRVRRTEKREFHR